MQKRTVLLDSDGCLSNWLDSALRVHGRIETHDDITDWNFFKAWGMIAEEFYAPQKNREFWENIEPYPWAVDMYKRIKERFKVVICTAAIESEECLAGKMAWLRKHLGCSIVDVVFANQKDLLAHPLHILIDDGAHNVHAFAAEGGIALGFKQPWNRFEHTHENIHEALDQYFIP